MQKDPLKGEKDPNVDITRVDIAYIKQSILGLKFVRKKAILPTFTAIFRHFSHIQVFLYQKYTILALKIVDPSIRSKVRTQTAIRELMSIPLFIWVGSNS